MSPLTRAIVAAIVLVLLIWFALSHYLRWRRRMPVRCAWCYAVIVSGGAAPTSHTICRSCADRFGESL